MNRSRFPFALALLVCFLLCVFASDQALAVTVSVTCGQQRAFNNLSPPRSLTFLIHNTGDCSARFEAYDQPNQAGAVLLDITIAPDQFVEVNRPAPQARSVRISAVGGGAQAVLVIGPPPPNPDPVWARTGDHAYNTNLGSVGIGTTSPQGRLHVSHDQDGIAELLLSNLNAGGSSDTRARLTVEYADGVNRRAWALQSPVTSTADGAFGILDLGPTSGGQGTPVVTIAPSGTGNIGIGTTNPQAKLEIQGEAWEQLEFSTTAGGTVKSFYGLRSDGPEQNQFWVSGWDMNRDPVTGQFGDPEKTHAAIRVHVDDSDGYILFHTGAQNGAHAPERVRIAADGSVGIGVSNPLHPLHMASGAHVTASGVWMNASSRAYKENVRDLEACDALAALVQLRPTRFSYKSDGSEEYVGFIAEDVPQLVATKDRKGLSPMDFVAVLTKVVQAQQAQIEDLKEAVEALKSAARSE